MPVLAADTAGRTAQGCSSTRRGGLRSACRPTRRKWPAPALAEFGVRQRPVQTAWAGHHQIPIRDRRTAGRLIELRLVRSGGCGHAADRVAGLRQPEQVRQAIDAHPRHRDWRCRTRLSRPQLAGIAVRRAQPMWTHPLARSLSHRTPPSHPGPPPDPRPPNRPTPIAPPQPTPRPRATNHRRRWPSDSPTQPTPPHRRRSPGRIAPRRPAGPELPGQAGPAALAHVRVVGGTWPGWPRHKVPVRLYVHGRSG